MKCIQYYNISSSGANKGRVIAVTDEEADAIVATGRARFATRSLWKKTG